MRLEFLAVLFGVNNYTVTHLQVLCAGRGFCFEELGAADDHHGHICVRGGVNRDGIARNIGHCSDHVLFVPVGDQHRCEKQDRYRNCRCTLHLFPFSDDDVNFFPCPRVELHR